MPDEIFRAAFAALGKAIAPCPLRLRLPSRSAAINSCRSFATAVYWQWEQEPGGTAGVTPLDRPAS
jgi:hypothetical protein